MASSRILIVEDESIIVADIDATLRELGYDVCGTASSGDEAYMLAEKLKPDLILMDILIEGEADGIETAERINFTLDIPIVYLTAHANGATIERATATRPYGYIVKPFNEQVLHSNIEMALYRHRTDSELKRLNKMLIESLNKVKQLTGLLPICASCKRIRTENGFWERIESYIAEHSDADFTHGICPECAEKLKS